MLQILLDNYQYTLPSHSCRQFPDYHRKTHLIHANSHPTVLYSLNHKNKRLVKYHIAFLWESHVKILSPETATWAAHIPECQ